MAGQSRKTGQTRVLDETRVRPSVLIGDFTFENARSSEPPPPWCVEKPVLMCACDNGYAMPLAAALASVVRNAADADSPWQLVLLDGGIQPDNWSKLLGTLEDLGLPTIRIQADHRAVADMNVSHHISHTAYFRLLSSQWLPDWIYKVVYLDCDVIAQADVRELWQISARAAADARGYPYEVWAVPDIACPFLDPKVGCEHYSHFAPYFASLHPIPNRRALGLPADALYFNSGVMVLDLDAWRRNQRSQELLDCLRQNQQFVWCWDQYALNVVFCGRWGNLPLAWNFGAHAYDYAASARLEGLSPLLPLEYREMWEHPKLIHYTTEIKPWHFYSFHPLKDRFYEYLDQTRWGGWRPVKPAFGVWWHSQTFQWQKRLMEWGRRWTLRLK